MDLQKVTQGFLLLCLILLIALVGVLVIVALFKAWNRFNRRYAVGPNKSPPPPDPWTVSASRIQPDPEDDTIDAPPHPDEPGESENPDRTDAPDSDPPPRRS